MSSLQQSREVFNNVVQVRSKKADLGLCSLSILCCPFEDGEEQSASATLGCLQLQITNQTGELVVTDTLDADTPLWNTVQGYMSHTDVPHSTTFDGASDGPLSGLLLPNLATAEDDSLFKKGTRSIVIHIPGRSASKALTVQFPTAHDAWSFCLSLLTGAITASVYRGGVPCTLWIPIPFVAENEERATAGEEGEPKDPPAANEVTSVTLQLRRLYSFCAETLVLQQALDFTVRQSDSPHTFATLSLERTKEEEGGLPQDILQSMLGTYLANYRSQTKPSAVVALAAAKGSPSYIVSELSKQFDIGSNEDGTLCRTRSAGATHGEDITTSFANTSFAHNAASDALGARGSRRLGLTEGTNSLVYVLVVSMTSAATDEDERKARVLEKLRAKHGGFGARLPGAGRSSTPSGLQKSPRPSAPNAHSSPSPDPPRAVSPRPAAQHNPYFNRTDSPVQNVSMAVINNNSMAGNNSIVGNTSMAGNNSMMGPPGGDGEGTQVYFRAEQPPPQDAPPHTAQEHTRDQSPKVGTDSRINDVGEADDAEEGGEEWTVEALTRLANKLERRKKRLAQREEDLTTMEGEILRRADLMTQEQSELADERQRLHLMMLQQRDRLAPPTGTAAAAGANRRGRAQSTSSNGSASQDREDEPSSKANNNNRPLSFQAVNSQNPHVAFQPPRSPREFYDKRVLPGRLCDAFPLFTTYVRNVSFGAAPVAIVSAMLFISASLTLTAPLLAVILPGESFVGLPPLENSSAIISTFSGADRSAGEFSLIFFGLQSVVLAVLVIRQFAFQRDNTYNLLHLLDHSLRYHSGTTDGSAIPYITGGNDPSENANASGERSAQAFQSFRFLHALFWTPLVLLGCVLMPVLAFIAYNNSPATSANLCADDSAVAFFFTPMTLLTFFMLAISNLIALQMVLVPMGLVAHVLFHRIATCVPQQHGAVLSSIHIRSAMARYQYIRVRLATRATQLFGATAGALVIGVLWGLLFGLLAALWEPFVVGSMNEKTGLPARTHPGVVVMGVVASINAVFVLTLVWGGIVGGFRQATLVSISSLTLQCERWTRGDFVAETDMPFLPQTQQRQQQQGKGSSSGSASTGLSLFSQAITMFQSYSDSELFAGLGVQLLPLFIQNLCCCCGMQSMVEPYVISFDNECHTTIGITSSRPANSKIGASTSKKLPPKKRQTLRIEVDNSNEDSERSRQAGKGKGDAEGISPQDDDDDESYSADETTGLVTKSTKKQRQEQDAAALAKPLLAGGKKSDLASLKKGDRNSATINNNSFNNVPGTPDQSPKGGFVVRDTVDDNEMDFHDAGVRASTVQFPSLCNVWWMLLFL